MDLKEIEEIYNKYFFIIPHYCKKILQSEEDIRDALQEIMLKLIKNYKEYNFENREHLVRWLIVATKNYCKNMKRKDSRIEHSIPVDSIVFKSKHDSEIIDTLSREKILKTFNKKVQHVITLKYEQGLKLQEIQKETGYSIATIERYLLKFRKKYRKIYETNNNM